MEEYEARTHKWNNVIYFCVLFLFKLEPPKVFAFKWQNIPYPS